MDRVACPWLIRHFVDPQAEFFFVSEDQLLETARKEGAIPFDATRFPEVKLNHRGERCTFEAILEDHKLTDPVLHRLALIVRGADVKGQEHVSPESLGLRAIVHGFALGISDEERLAREFPIYDRYTSTFASNRIKPIGFGFPAVKQEEVITMFRSMKKRRLLLLASASLTVPDMSVLAQDTPSDYRTF